MRLLDIVSPSILERAIHRPKNDNTDKDREELSALNKEVAERHQHVTPLAEVLAHCIQQCGVPEGVDPQLCLDIQWTTLAAIDAAIELATKETE